MERASARWLSRLTAPSPVSQVQFLAMPRLPGKKQGDGLCPKCSPEARSPRAKSRPYCLEHMREWERLWRKKLPPHLMEASLARRHFNQSLKDRKLPKGACKVCQESPALAFHLKPWEPESVPLHYWNRKGVEMRTIWLCRLHHKERLLARRWAERKKSQ